MGILEALQMDGTGLFVGNNNRWMFFDENRGEWVVMEQSKDRNVPILYTDNEEEAVNLLIEEDMYYDYPIY